MTFSGLFYIMVLLKTYMTAMTCVGCTVAGGVSVKKKLQLFFFTTKLCNKCPAGAGVSTDWTFCCFSRRLVEEVSHYTSTVREGGVSLYCNTLWLATGRGTQGLTRRLLVSGVPLLSFSISVSIWELGSDSLNSTVVWRTCPTLSGVKSRRTGGSYRCRFTVFFPPVEVCNTR